MRSADLPAQVEVARAAVAALDDHRLHLPRPSVRPGDQIDKVDSRQIPLLSGFDPTVRATRPAVRFNERDFWAQGINFGLEIRF